ncbi:MAG: GIY-YIG nuclease family protein [Patescibacteria group bacterium]
MYAVYLLRAKNGKLYIGCTGDLKKRLALHNNGKVASTRNLRPLKLIYSEFFVSKKDAFEREAKLKYHAQSLRRLKERLRETLRQSSVWVG